MRVSLDSRSRTLVASACATLVLLLAHAHAEPPAQLVKRPSLGVALEGGGALGLAHVGVLEWLEEHRIPVDFVGGTSMGGLVGGMYATGMRPKQIRKVVSDIDWDAALGTQVTYRDLAYRRKQDRRDFQNSLEFGLRNGLGAPSGLNSGQEITFVLDRHTLPYSDLRSFDDLPVPFRCVGTDLSTGKPHIFDGGPLGEALRATMSLPAFFTPVKQDDSVYADGGMLNNLPVDVVKGMGADVVIAVHLDIALEKQEAAPSMLGVMGRSISIMIAANELRSMQLADLLVTVELKGYTSSQYKRGDEIIARGYEAANSKAAVLARFAVNEEEWQRYLERRESRQRVAPTTPASVEIAGIAARNKSALEPILSSHAGKPLETAKLERDLRQVAGLGRYSRFSYRWSGTTEPHLIVTGEERGYAPPLLNIGFDIDGSDYTNVRFAATARITALDIGGYRSEWRTDLSVGSIWGIKSEYYHPLTPASRWFVAPHVSAANSPFDLYDRSERLAAYRFHQYSTGLDAGYALDRFSEIRLGYDTGYFRSDLSVGLPILPTPSGRTGATTVRYELDRFDDPIIPREGLAIRWRAQWVDAWPGAKKAFPLSDLYVADVRRVSRSGSVYVQGFGGTTFGHDDTGLPQFFLGGPIRLGAYGLNELRGDQYFLGRAGYMHELFRLPPLIGNKAFVTSTYEIGKVYGPRVQYKLPMDGAVALVMETFLGPVAIGGSYGDAGHRKWYFQVGRIF